MMEYCVRISKGARRLTVGSSASPGLVKPVGFGIDSVSGEVGTENGRWGIGN